MVLYPPIKETDVHFARAILVAITYLFIMAVFFAGLVALGLAGPPAKPAELLAVFAATSLLGFGFGTTNAVVLSLGESWRHVEKILTRPLFFISRIFFVPSYLPPRAIEWLKWNPVLHAVEWMRDGYYSNYDSTVLDMGYLLAFALVLTFLGLAGERLTRIRRGSA